MEQRISEINIVPIKPRDGLVAFASLVLDDNLYLGSIGIVTRPQGGYRLTYPMRTSAGGSFNVFHPISKEFSHVIEKAVMEKFHQVSSNDRYMTYEDTDLCEAREGHM